MVTVAFFRRMFRYSHWANGLVIESLAACSAAQAEGVPLVAHLMAAEGVWLARLTGQSPELPVWPELTLEQCSEWAERHRTGWQRYLEGLADDQLDTTIEYKHQSGQEFRSQVVDILTQLVTHGPYHRGQIAKIVARHGGTAAASDYIYYCRAGGE